MPCHQAQKRREHRAWVEQHRVEQDRFEGLTDPVEIALELVKPASTDELVLDVAYPRSLVEVIAEMDGPTRGRLRDLAAAKLEQPGQAAQGVRLAEALALFDVNLSAVQKALVGIEDLEPHLFWRCPADVVAACLARLDPPRGCVDQILLALAASHHPDALEQFRLWQEAPPSFAGALHVPIAEYLHYGGLELRDGVATPLHDASCHALVPPNAAAAKPGVGVLTHHDQPCRFCGDAISVLFAIERPATLLPTVFADAPAPWPRLSIPFCERCSCYGTLCFDVAPDGTFAWHSANVRPAFVEDGAWQPLPRRPLTLGGARPPAPRSWASELAPLSQVGGLPSWVQDVEYPPCPACERTMPFVGQLAIEDFDDGEGLHYAFFCGSCGTSATVYQQT